jgi:hypothetical protein
MTETPFPNAFTINGMGADGAFFPFSVKYRQPDGIASLFICPQRLIDLCDVLEVAALDRVVVFDVGQASVFNEQTQMPLTIEALAADAGVECHPLDSTAIVLHKRDLFRLLDGFSHYEFLLFDVGPDWREEQLISQVLVCREHDWGSAAPVLSALSHSRLFLASHDDCYLTLQAAEAGLPQWVMARTLQIYAGTVLRQGRPGSRVEVEPPSDLVVGLWQAEFDLTILREMTVCENGQLQIGVSRRAYRFGEAGEYPVDFSIIYDVAQGWTVAPKRDTYDRQG